ncbi:MAG: hypothetical protein IE931_10740 [Sphingobacteriales bacterium]|nr:hypothetical protein [Sphingobacteriales bacterium]
MITKENTAQHIVAYLQHKITLRELVDWAENAVQEEDFEPNHETILMQILGSLGVSDVRTFGLTWEDCENIMKKLGYEIKVEASLAS